MRPLSVMAPHKVYRYIFDLSLTSVNNFCFALQFESKYMIIKYNSHLSMWSFKGTEKVTNE